LWMPGAVIPSSFVTRMMGSSLITPTLGFELVFFLAGDFFFAFAIINAAKMLIIFGCNEYQQKIRPFGTALTIQ
jgi:hypothetical protein